LDEAEAEIANKLSNWVALVVAAARANLEARRAERGSGGQAGAGLGDQPFASPGSRSGGASVGGSSATSVSTMSRSVRGGPAAAQGGGGLRQPPRARKHPVKGPGRAPASRLLPGQLPPKSMAQLPKIISSADGPDGPGPRGTPAGQPSLRAEKFKKAVRAGGAGPAAAPAAVKPPPRGWKKPAARADAVDASGGAAGSAPGSAAALQKEMWPVHSELIEMGLHVHPVLLTLASTLRDGVVSLEDGLLAKVNKAPSRPLLAHYLKHTPPFPFHVDHVDVALSSPPLLPPSSAPSHNRRTTWSRPRKP